MEIGQAVTVRWTNANRQYEGKGTVVKINAKSVRVALSEEVPSQWGGAPYAIGREIIVPRFGTLYNCVLE